MKKVLFTVVYQDYERHEEMMVHAVIFVSVSSAAEVEEHISWECEDMDIEPKHILKMIYVFNEQLYVTEFNGYPYKIDDRGIIG